MKIEILVAAIGQTDLSLHEKMNIRCDAVIANQCGVWRYDEEEHEYGKIRMLSSATKGVGINRNLALRTAVGDILLFADDDIVYYDGSIDAVVRSFEELPDADVIFFGLDMTKNGEIYERRRHKVKKLHLYNAMKFGASRMAVRRESVEKYRLCFSTLFGGGSIYGSGEDSIFVRDCFRAGLRVYSHSHVLGKCAKDTSTWFGGYNEKYIFDKGALISCAFPKTKHLVKWYFIRRFAKKSGFSYAKTRKYLNSGIAAFKTLRSWESYESEE